MSTSSKYSPNKLKQVIENGTQHFVLKCYVTAAFEYHRKKAEYYLYWFNKNAGVDPDNPKYKNMSSKRMGRKEVVYFYSMMQKYKEQNCDDTGCVWEHKEIGFNKSLVLVTQMSLDFNQGS